MNKVYLNDFNKDSSVISYGSTMNKSQNTDFLSKLN